jgi:hypothetical protein
MKESKKEESSYISGKNPSCDCKGSVKGNEHKMYSRDGYEIKSENDIREHIAYCVDARRENGVGGLSLERGYATRVRYGHSASLQTSQLFFFSSETSKAPTMMHMTH